MSHKKCPSDIIPCEVKDDKFLKLSDLKLDSEENDHLFRSFKLESNDLIKSPSMSTLGVIVKTPTGTKLHNLLPRVPSFGSLGKNSEKSPNTPIRVNSVKTDINLPRTPSFGNMGRNSGFRKSPEYFTSPSTLAPLDKNVSETRRPSVTLTSSCSNKQSPLSNRLSNLQS